MYSVTIYDQPAALVCDYLTEISHGAPWAVGYADPSNDTLSIKLSFIEPINGVDTRIRWSHEVAIDAFMFETKYVLDGSEFSFEQLERDAMGDDVEDCHQFSRRLGLTRHGREVFAVVAQKAADEIIGAVTTSR